MSKREPKVSRRFRSNNGYELPAARDQTIALVAFFLKEFSHVFFK